jgi:hypothetical protein
MRSGFGQVQQRAAVRPVEESPAPPVPVPNGREIPYDYVAKFLLEGTRGRRQQDVINISIEGAFIATAIAYSFIPKRAAFPSTPIKVGVTTVFLAPGSNVTLADVIADAIAFELNKRTSADRNDIALHAASTIVPCLLVYLCGIDFKYSVVDSGTGRELQNQPIHNIAGLGKADGDRPFRPFPKPMTFLPRSTIRIEIEEISEGPLYKDAELQIVLHGYKMLGFGAAP